MGFKWTGSKVECYSDSPVLPKDCSEFYTSFSYNGEEFVVGEYALFKHNNKFDLTRVGRLMCVFQSLKEDTKYSGIVRWYTWARNLQDKLPKFDDKNEIVEEMSSSDTRVSLKDIQKKCNVIFCGMSEKIFLIKELNFNLDVFFSCRYKIKHDRPIPYFSEESINIVDCLGLDAETTNPSDSSVEEESGLTKHMHSETYNKRKSSCTGSVIILDSEDSDVDMNRIKSPSNPSKNLKLTPKGCRKISNEAHFSPLQRNLSVKRVLNDSFEDLPTSPSGIPIFRYSIINSVSTDPKQLKIKLKLTEPPAILKVFPTTLDDELVQMKSPVKVSDLREVRKNHIELSPNSKAKLSETNAHQCRTRAQVGSPYTPAQISSTRRRSSRTIQRPSYAEYWSPEENTPKKRSRRPSTDSHRSFATKTPTTEIIETKRFLSKIDEDEDLNDDQKHKNKSERLKRDSRTNGYSKKHIHNASSSDESDKLNESEQITSKVKYKLLERLKNENSIVNSNQDSDSNEEWEVIAPRPKRNAGTPKRYTDNDYSKTEDIVESPRRTRGRPKKDHNGHGDADSARLKCNIGRPTKRNSSDDESDKNKSRPTRSAGRPKKYSDDHNDDSDANSARLKCNIGRPTKRNSSDDESEKNKNRPTRSVGRPKKYSDDHNDDNHANSARLKCNFGRPTNRNSSDDESDKNNSRPTRSAGRPKKYSDDHNDDSDANSARLKCNIGRPTNRNSSDDESEKNKNRPTRSVGRPKKYSDDHNDDNHANSARLKRSVVHPKRYITDDESDNNRNKMCNAKSPKRRGVDKGNTSNTKSPLVKRRGRPKKFYESDDSDSDMNKSQTKNNHKTPSKTPFSTTKIAAGSGRKSALKNSRKTLIYDSDDEGELESRTPKAPRQKSTLGTPRSVVKDTPTARARMIREGIITPSVQARNKAVVKESTPLAKARTQLHVSFVPKSLPCREKEYADIINFLEGKLLDGCGGCMYVSGVPGTGKTATVTEVIRNLQKSVENGGLPSFKYVNINGMRLSEPRQSYVEIVKQLMGKTVHWEQAQTMLENKFVKSQKKSAPIILVVDELDILCTKRQDVVYNLLDWPTKANAQLIVITIANTMDLPERLLMGRVTSRLGLTRLTFQAYTHKQLQEIVSKRLGGISAFNPDAIQLVARKVASVSGDARRALDICRRAVEIAELEGKHTLVSMTHVNLALNAMITQPKVQAIKRCSRLEKLILQAVVAEVERTGVEETNFASVLRMLITTAALDGFPMVSSTIAMAAVSKLGACRLLLVDQKCTNIYQRILLNVSADDVYYALTKTDV